MKTPDLPVAIATKRLYLKCKDMFTKMTSGQRRTTAMVTIPLYAWFCYHRDCMISGWHVIIR